MDGHIKRKRNKTNFFIDTSSTIIVERIHRELGRFFRVYTQHAHTAWAKYTETITTIVNETHYDTAGYTPVELHFNKNPQGSGRNT